MKYLKISFVSIFLMSFFILPQQGSAATVEELKEKIFNISEKIKKLQASQVLNATSVPSVKIISPNGGETFPKKTKMIIRWSAENIKISDWFQIHLINVSSGDEKSKKIASHIPSFKRFHSWSIPNSVNEDEYLIKISLCSKLSKKSKKSKKGLLPGDIKLCLGKINDKSDGSFKITNSDSLDERYFQFTKPENSGENQRMDGEKDSSESPLIVKITDPAVISQALDDLNGERQLIVGGIVSSDNGGFNSPWSWHLDPATIILGENFTEVCDAALSYVENNLSDWLGQQYCPWYLRVSAVYDSPPPASNHQVWITDTLNIRDKASLRSGKIGLARKGEKFKKIEETEDWVKIELSDGKTGWVFRKYVSQ